MNPRLEFNCPKCSSNLWLDLDGIGHCQGSYQSKPCPFKWPRGEDWMVFAFVIRFQTEAEYSVGKRANDGLTLLKRLGGS